MGVKNCCVVKTLATIEKANIKTLCIIEKANLKTLGIIEEAVEVIKTLGTIKKARKVMVRGISEKPRIGPSDAKRRQSLGLLYV